MRIVCCSSASALSRGYLALTPHHNLIVSLFRQFGSHGLAPIPQHISSKLVYPAPMALAAW
eukprot:m.4932 g.4932  ORF g.4932 m.4932 type:complete len:61 (+) comp4415_c0_seq1:299-481(+)